MAYTLIRSRRKTISLQIAPDGTLTVRCPQRMAKRDVEAFLQEKESWIRKHQTHIAARPQLPALTPEELKSLAERAASVIPQRLQHFAPLVGVTYHRVTIRSQHTRWGSCSAKGNLNFNCLLMLAPPEVLDYVVVHELCHRRELNHSPAFWAEVARVLPGYAAQRKWLREEGGALIRRLPR